MGVTAFVKDVSSLACSYSCPQLPLGQIEALPRLPSYRCCALYEAFALTPIYRDGASRYTRAARRGARLAAVGLAGVRRSRDEPASLCVFLDVSGVQIDK